MRCDAGRDPAGRDLADSLPGLLPALSAGENQGLAGQLRKSQWPFTSTLYAVAAICLLPWPHPVPCRAGLWAFAHAVPFACFLFSTLSDL